MPDPRPDALPAGCRALIVADDPDTEAALRTALAALAVAVDAVDSVDAALAILATGRHRLAVCGLHAPAQGGLALLSAARAVDPTLPVILTGAYGDVASPAQALDLGAADFLMTPLDPVELVPVLRRALVHGCLAADCRDLRRRLAAPGAGPGASAPPAGLRLELRTPLATILAMCEALAGDGLGSLNPRQRRALSRVVESARHLLGLAEDLAGSAGDGADRGRTAPGVVDFTAADALATATAIAAGDALGRQVRFTVAGSCPGQLRADRHRLVQLLVNLLAGAIRSSPPGAAIHVDLGAAGDAVCYAIGGGPLAAAPAPAADPGLARARALARLLGADLEVPGAGGAGGRLRLTLPRSPVSDLVAAGS